MTASLFQPSKKKGKKKTRPASNNLPSTARGAGGRRTEGKDVQRSSKEKNNLEESVLYGSGEGYQSAYLSEMAVAPSEWNGENLTR